MKSGVWVMIMIVVAALSFLIGYSLAPRDAAIATAPAAAGGESGGYGSADSGGYGSEDSGGYGADSGGDSGGYGVGADSGGDSGGYGVGADSGGYGQ